jgi:hypothetical protein
MAKLTAAQEALLKRIKRYPKGVKVDAAQHRTAMVLCKAGLIEYDDWRGIARGKGK